MHYKTTTNTSIDREFNSLPDGVFGIERINFEMRSQKGRKRPHPHDSSVSADIGTYFCQLPIHCKTTTSILLDRELNSLQDSVFRNQIIDFEMGSAKEKQDPTDMIHYSVQIFQPTVVNLLFITKEQ